MVKSNLFDPRLKKIIIQMVDISYGGENGLQQAIELSSEILGSVRLIQEKKINQFGLRKHKYNYLMLFYPFILIM